jgi:aspartate aminotransferase
MRDIEVLNPDANLILAITSECRRRKAMGEKVIDLSLGEPDLNTPPRIVAAASRALEQGHTRYVPTAGIAPLRVALRRSLGKEGLDYAPQELMATCGATGALWCALRVMLRQGDEVLLPVPTFPPYYAQIRMAGGIPVSLHTRQEDGFKLTAEMLRAGVTERTRLLILNSPANPTGAVYTRAELEALASVILERGLFVISDEVYSSLVYGDARHLSLAALSKELRQQVLVIRSFSKSHAMTGWRIGFAAGPEQLIEQMISVQELSVLSPASVSQWAAVEALREMPEEAAERLAGLDARRRYVLERLERMTGAPVRADGGLFAFPDLSGPGRDVTKLCRYLLDREALALVPGAAFGAPWCARISYVGSLAELEEGMDRLSRGLNSFEEGKRAAGA